MYFFSECCFCLLFLVEPVETTAVAVTVEETKEEVVEDVKLDWWSKYYASIGEFDKCGKYLEEGHQKLQIYDKELEEMKPFNGFGDFVKGFLLERGKDDDEEDDNVVGEFKVKKIFARGIPHARAPFLFLFRVYACPC